MAVLNLHHLTGLGRPQVPVRQADLPQVKRGTSHSTSKRLSRELIVDRRSITEDDPEDPESPLANRRSSPRDA
jgi:hypothetical protein